MMMVPGVNLYDYATQVIATTSIQYYKASPRSTNAIGQYVPQYQDPLTITGSLQPVAKNLYTQLGLDLQKSYYYFYSPIDIQEVTRDVSSDKFVYNSVTYKVLSATDWLTLDKWKAILAVQVLNDG